MAERDLFELELAGALRAYAEDAPTQVDPTALARQLAGSHPVRRFAVGPWSLRLSPATAWLLLLGAVLVAATSLAVGAALLRLVDPQPIPPVPPVAPAPSFDMYAPGSACLEFTTPHAPGPRDQARPPTGLIRADYDPEGKRILAVARDERPDRTMSWTTWSFDVCTNQWTELLLGTWGLYVPPPAFGGDPEALSIVAATGADRLLAADGDGRVWAFNPGRLDQWRPVGAAPVAGPIRLAYDPIANRVFALSIPGGRIWTFDQVAGTWTEIEQPGPGWAMNDEVLLAYDAAAGRLVAVQGTLTAVFDPRTATWFRSLSEAPWPRSWTPLDRVTGGEIAYDEDAGRVTVYRLGLLFAYDVDGDRWETLKGDPWTAGTNGAPSYRVGHAMVYDAANRRLVVYGGVHRTSEWFPQDTPADDVVAFDASTREWITLLEPSAP